ncbi:MAG: methionine--tRNA ligase [Rhodospirillales bacterium]
MPKKYYLTTPIYYVNDVPHIGHAYTTLACDVLARFKRLDGFDDVKFLTGTDEHGQKVAKSAEAAGVDPQTFTDRVSQNFRDLADLMNFSHDDFIRTTEARHKKASQAIWKAIAEGKTPKGNDNIYLDSYVGWYAVRDEAFYTEDDLTDGPDGKKIVKNSGAEVEWVEEPSYFFRLSEWGDRLLEFYDDNPDFIAPRTRRNEVTSFVSGGLKDLSISRTTFDWGVPVPGDDEHIMYVWLDALTNYITGVGYPETETGQYAHYWPADLHMVGKDILRFHAVYWPAFLMAAELKPPKRVYAHGWWTNEGEKISKSLGNIIDPIDLVNKYGLDQVRYFLLREMPFGNDGNFAHNSIVNRMNGELANEFGNLAQRVLSMINKNCDGKVPVPGELTDDDYTLKDNSQDLIRSVRPEMERQAFHQALEYIWTIIRSANVYVDSQAPWKLKKENPARMNTVLFVGAESIRNLSLLLLPFMPDSCGKVLDQLSVGTEERTFEFHGVRGELKPGTELPKPEGVFPRYQDEEEAGKGE